MKEVLRDLGLESQPTIMVLNKADQVPDRSFIDVLRANHEESIVVSAFKKEGLDRLEQAVREKLHELAVETEVVFEPALGKLVHYLSQNATVIDQRFEDEIVRIRCLLPRRCFAYMLENGAKLDPVAKYELTAERG